MSKELSVMAKAAENAVKKLDDFRLSVPEQLLMFFIDEPTLKKYSQAIALYDTAPKYFIGKYKSLFQDGKLVPVTRPFVHEKEEYNITIHPAFIEPVKGQWEMVMPTEREEIVEDVLRKLATDGRAVFLDNQAGVLFTLYDVRKELKARGRTLSINEIKEAITVCSRAHLKITTNAGKVVLEAPMFTVAGLVTMNDWENHGQRAKSFVQFNPLVTEAIRSGNYRQINYETAMAYSRALARWLHKRLSLRYRQAATDAPYSITHSTIVRDSGMLNYSRDRMAMKRVEEALEEMKERGTLASYRADKIIDAGGNHKIVDVSFTLVPSEDFIKETKRANYKETQVRDKLRDLEKRRE